MMGALHKLSHSFQRLSLIAQMVILTILVGSFSWFVTAAINSRIVEQTFEEQYTKVLNERAMDYRFRFRRYLLVYLQTVKLLVSRRDFVLYVDNAQWPRKDVFEVTVHKNVPEWLGGSSLLRTFAAPRHALLIDGDNAVREIYSSPKKPLPELLRRPTPRLLSLCRDETYIASLDNEPYLLACSSTFDNSGKTLATLLFATPLDAELLFVAQGSSARGRVVALITADSPNVLVSSMPETVPPGRSLASLQQTHLIFEQEALEYGASEVNFKFAMLVPKEMIAKFSDKVLRNEKLQHGIQSILFIVMFALIMFWITFRIRKLTRRVDDFSREALGGSIQELTSGDELQVLERRFLYLTEEVEISHEFVRRETEAHLARSAELERQQRRLQILQSVTEAVGVGVLMEHDGKLSSANEPMMHYAAICGDLSVFAVDAGSDIERDIKGVDGKKHVFQITAPEILAGEKVILAREVTARKLAERELQSSENKYRTLLENLPQKIFLKDLESKYISCNENFARDFQLSSNDIAGMTDFDLFPRELAEKYREDDRRIVQARKMEEIEEQYLDGDKREVIVHTVKIPVEDDDGHVIGLLGVFWDVTARKKDEEERARLEALLRQAQKMEAIGTLAGGIAHDFNNILSAILGYTELVQLMLPAKNEIAEHLKEVIHAGLRARDLVQQILTFSRQSEQERKPLQVYLIVKEVLKLMRASIPTTIEIRENIDPESGTVLADPTQIHQVLMNLCTNAYHAMRETGGVLTVELTRVEIESDDSKVLGQQLTPGPYLRIQVSDTGHGMERAIVERIFEPYFSTKKKGEGTGMGLALVHGIVKGHGGHVTVYSEPGKGTTFQVYLPKIVSNVARLETALAEPLPHGSERILLVDDEEAIVNVEQLILKGLGYRVTAMSSSEEALQVFSLQPNDFDLVITDMTMPHMTGVELTKKLLAVRADIPIILCTGFSELINGEKAQAIGIREYVMKPIARKKIAEVVRKVLDGKIS